MAFQMADDVKGTFWTSTESGKAGGGRRPQAEEDAARGVGPRSTRRRPIAAGCAEIYLDGVRATDGRGPMPLDARR